jgi:hypothetical protein
MERFFDCINVDSIPFSIDEQLYTCMVLTFVHFTRQESRLSAAERISTTLSCIDRSRVSRLFHRDIYSKCQAITFARAFSCPAITRIQCHFASASRSSLLSLHRGFVQNFPKQLKGTFNSSLLCHWILVLFSLFHTKTDIVCPYKVSTGLTVQSNPSVAMDSD